MDKEGSIYMVILYTLTHEAAIVRHVPSGTMGMQTFF